MAVDVWVLTTAALVRDGTLPGLERSLSADERDRLPAFRVTADRIAYAAAHGLARHALSTHAPGVAPGTWTFRTGPRGRPEVDGPAPQRGLRFNLSHTRGTVACVVTDGVACGIDVERRDGAADVDLLAHGVLSAAERRRLDGLGEAGRRAEFFRHWTLKEAYAKARGDGLLLPLDRCEFDPSADPVRARLPDDDRAWRFEQWEQDDCVVALALQSPSRAPVTRHSTLYEESGPS
ncbi:MAG TPA: 4'-phosphopantetheinyl transferase superfamily protein [Streptosporangiales bacterium]